MFKLLLTFALLAVAAAECPNACSGHGTCGQYDMCTCYDRWTSNDCSERVCPYGFSFVTTPQGDLNMDGDRYDNTQKLVVKQIGGAANTGTITENDNILTLEKTIAGSAAEDLITGDALRVGGETFVVTAVNGNELTLDHDRFTTITGDNVYKFVETVTAPKGTWESWVGDFNENDEGHYYMECSNRGLCDRKEGACTCFDGYDGSACQRQACPNDCSGHGTCETVGELSVQNATQFTSFHVDTATAGSTSITLTRDPAITDANDPISSYASLNVGDVISLEKPNNQQLTVMTISSNTITTDPATTNSFMFGTRVYASHTYNLWDNQKDRACVCDYSYAGNDCSQRDCPHGDDPLTKMQAVSTGWIKDQMYKQSVESSWTTSALALTAAQSRHGTANYEQKNEKQNIYLDTMRGSLSGSFTLTFTDAFGQQWTTKAIDMNGRLSSKAYVSASSTTTVSFSPSLPYGEIKVGDFLMIGDERHEVLTTYPEVSTSTSRPIKLGGVVDSVLVRNGYGQGTTGAYAFRAGPAKGIEDALEALPNGVVAGVTTETFNSGSLIGYAREGISTYNGKSYFRGIVGNHDIHTARGTPNTIDEVGEDYAQARTNGGLAPYDMVRVVAASGFSEFVQLKHVDVSGTSGDMVHAIAKGKLTAQAQSASGVGATKTGAIYRQGGYHIRVTFDTNSGDLQELDVDTSGLYSVFFREFSGTVASKDPTRVVARSHDSNDIQVAADKKNAAKQTMGSAKYPVPFTYYSATTRTGSDCSENNACDLMSENIPTGDTDFQSQDTFRGAQFDLKLMAGMKVKIANQVRTVVKEIHDSDRSVDDDTNEVKRVAAFHVDAPFEANDQSRRVGDEDYIFYEYPVEQLYDEATYNNLALAQTVFINQNQYVYSELSQNTQAVNKAAMRIILSHNKIGTCGLNTDAGWGTSSAAVCPKGNTALSNGATVADGLATTGGGTATTTAYPGSSNAGAHRYTGLERGFVADGDGRLGVNEGSATTHVTEGVAVKGYGMGFGNILGIGNTWVVGDDESAGTTTCSGFVPSEFVTAGMMNNVLNPQGQHVSVHATNNGLDSALTATRPLTPVPGCVFRSYKSLNSFEDRAGPPLALNGQTRWALVTDQRPLRWNSPQVDSSSKSSVTYSLANVRDRGVMSAGAGALTASLDASGASGTYISIASTTSNNLAVQTTLTGSSTFSGPDALTEDYSDDCTGGVCSPLATTCTAGTAVNGQCGSGAVLTVTFTAVATWTIGVATAGSGYEVGNVLSIADSQFNTVDSGGTDFTGNTMTYTIAAGDLDYGEGGRKITLNGHASNWHQALNVVNGDYLYVRISGCTVDTQYNNEFLVKVTSATILTTEVNPTQDAWSTYSAGHTKFFGPQYGDRVGYSTLYNLGISAAICAGDTVTVTTRAGSLIDSKAIAIGDRVKVKRAATVGSYDTRSVDKIWGTGNDVSLFSVVDAYASSPSYLTGLESEAWVDEAGTTEDLTCSRRGLCDGDTGVCACFAGYTTANCGTQNALAS